MTTELGLLLRSISSSHCTSYATTPPFPSTYRQADKRTSAETPPWSNQALILPSLADEHNRYLRSIYRLTHATPSRTQRSALRCLQEDTPRYHLADRRRLSLSPPRSAPPPAYSHARPVRVRTGRITCPLHPTPCTMTIVDAMSSPAVEPVHRRYKFVDDKGSQHHHRTTRQTTRPPLHYSQIIVTPLHASHRTLLWSTAASLIRRSHPSALLLPSPLPLPRGDSFEISEGFDTTASCRYLISDLKLVANLSFELFQLSQDQHCMTIAPITHRHHHSLLARQSWLISKKSLYCISRKVSM